VAQLWVANSFSQFVNPKQVLQPTEHGHLDVVGRLLTAQADVHAVPSSDSRSALQAAEEGGYQIIVDRLKGAGAR
jgi:hypothetical protein